jgi:hypothetical protein
MVILNYLNYNFVSNLGDTPYIVVEKQIRFCRLLALCPQSTYPIEINAKYLERSGS